MCTVYENQTSIDLAYRLGQLNGNKKFIVDDTKIYVFMSGSAVVFSFGNKSRSITISDGVPIEDIVDFTDEIVGSGTFTITECAIENLTVDRVENIYYTLLTEDNNSIVLTEDFFETIPKDGDLVDGNLNILVQETKDKKDAIDNLFWSLVKK